MQTQAWIGGLVLGAALGAGGLYLAQTLGEPETDPCLDRCGDGTVCEAERCVVAPEPEAEVEAEPEPEGKSKRKGKRRRGKGSDGDDAGTAADAPTSGPPIDDDSGVPKFQMDKDQTIGAADGSERLSDAQIDKTLRALDPAFQRCVRDAAERVDDLGTGKITFELGVAGSGKVTGVNARGPANLADAGLIPCVRKAIYAQRFPLFNGPEMRVSSSFRVD